MNESIKGQDGDNTPIIDLANTIKRTINNKWDIDTFKELFNTIPDSISSGTKEVPDNASDGYESAETSDFARLLEIINNNNFDLPEKPLLNVLEIDRKKATTIGKVVLTGPWADLLNRLNSEKNPENNPEKEDDK